MRALVTGASGFVGAHLLAAWRGAGHDAVAAGRSGVDGVDFLPLDLADGQNVRAVIDIARADVVFHLAAQTFVPDAIASPLATYETNVMARRGSSRRSAVPLPTERRCRACCS